LAGRADLEPGYAQACLARLQSEPLQGRVQYLGPVEPERLAAYYRAASCFVSASSMETFGMALQEARTYGLPIVARDGGYVRHHFTHGHDGILCDSVASLCETMLALVRDPARLHALCLHAQRSPDTSSDYTWQTAAAQLHEGLGRLFADSCRSRC
jgi:glycosyltransferase involved in cell wall biosynthesis